MAHQLGTRVYDHTLTRRDFLWLATLSTAGVATGCAVNPVTGDRQLMLMSEDQEIAVDQENSPHQFSADFGPVQDRTLNQYLSQVGNNLAGTSHRPNMPYSFRAVNATYVNAYAFPGGSIAATRGILLELENEAELAGLLGHEIGHVNARHTAERMSKSMLLTGLVGGLTYGARAYAESKDKDWDTGIQIGGVIANIGAGALLAHYSRDDEREADKLGMLYMTNAGENPSGMVGLMDILRSMSKHKPNAIEMMFATHPMSDERYQTAKTRAQTEYQNVGNRPFYRDRYMDYTAGLRQIKGAIDEMQEGERAMAGEQYRQAESHFSQALKQAPNEYAGLVMMANCQMAMERYKSAERYAERAKQVYPSEAQAHSVSGVAQLAQERYRAAYSNFDRYDRLLPGNPDMTFFKGVTLEGMQDRQKAAEHYYQYLQTVKQGPRAEYAYQRLVDWKVIEPAQ